MIIDSDSKLRSFFPNVFATAQGELSLFEKIKPELALAESWLSTNIVDVALLEGIPEESSQIRSSAEALVAAMALHDAAPSLDLALTATGFVTAGTPTAVPVSTQRMERLRRSLANRVDAAIDSLLRSLHSIPQWCDSAQGTFFSESLFQDLELCSLVFATESSESALPAEDWASPRFTRFLGLRSKAIQLEDMIAECYVSPELMEVLRAAALRRSLSVAQARVVREVRSQIVGYLNGACINDGRMRDLVNFIRQEPEAFPQWHNSDTANLFKSAYFENKKSSSGYFY